MRCRLGCATLVAKKLRSVAEKASDVWRKRFGYSEIKQLRIAKRYLVVRIDKKMVDKKMM